MKCRLFSCINTKMVFKLVGFQEPRASANRKLRPLFVWSVRDAVCANKAARKGCPKARETPQQTYATARVGEHRFEDCSPSH